MAQERRKMKRTLKGIRNDLGLTQQQMATRLDMKLANYRNLELGVTKMSAIQMIKILDIAGIDDYRDLKITS